VLPKQFIVDDLCLELAHTLAELQTLRKRQDATRRTLDAQRKRIEALRKRMDQWSKARAQKLRADQGQAEPEAKRPTERTAH
jgi:hypothetical protein